MKKRGATATAESEHLDAAVQKRAAETTIAKIAELAGVQPTELYQWRQGMRPVPWQRARLLAEVVATRPELISAEYAEILNDAPNFAASEPQRAPHKQSQSARPNKHILLEAVQVALVRASVTRSPITPEQLIEAYDLALERHAPLPELATGAKEDGAVARGSVGTGKDIGSPSRKRKNS